MEVVQPILKKMLCELCKEYEAINKCANCDKCICLKCTGSFKHARGSSLVDGPSYVISFNVCNECSMEKLVIDFSLYFEIDISDEEGEEGEEGSGNGYMGITYFCENCSIQ